MARLKWHADEPPRPAPRREVHFKRVRVDPDTPLWWDEHGNTFSDEGRTHATGLALVKLYTAIVEPRRDG